MPMSNDRFLPCDLLDCRMAMLGLDLSAVASRDAALFEAIMRRCADCEFRESCELDLKRDPNDPVWETYCPNTKTFLALAKIKERESGG